MVKYNLISCKGFIGEGDTVGWFAGGSCIPARLGIVILFFLFAIIRKWVAEPFGIQFSLITSTIAGLLSYVILVSIIGNFKISLIVGLFLGLIGGYFGGGILGDG